MSASGSVPLIRGVDLDNEAFAERLPHEAFTRLRREMPVGWYDWPHGKGFWCVTRYPDIVAVLKDWRTFSSEVGATALEDLEPDALAARQSMMDTDPPEHTRLRNIVNRGFTPRAVAAYTDLLRDLTRHILDEALPKGEFDFVEEIAKELPIQVLCRILGVPPEHDEQLIEWGDRMIANTDPEIGDVDPRSRESDRYRLLPFRSPAAKEVFEYGHRLAAERRRAPQDDLVSRMATWRDEDGNTLTEREFDTMFLILVVAGNETTRQAIAHGMAALMEHPEQMDRLRDDASVSSKVAADEIIRWASPVIHFRRTATADTEIRGVPVAAGDKVVVWLASGNRDEEQFPDPFRFDVTRRPNDHVSFGRGGPHFCIGSHLARLEVQVMFEELLPRLGSIEHAGPVRRIPSNFTNALKAMPVRVSQA